MTATQHPTMVISMNTFTPATGGIDALTEFQLAEMREMAAAATEQGWLGNEVYLANDGSALIVITRFRSEADRSRWAATERFRRHVAELEPLLADIRATPVTFLAANGSPLRRK
ncbi:antibiotic biosynthesis monooxygenase [Leucobacter sp. M11]|uniref:antibiotic biosynthesis monooxygenase n=1 Tax=Leucobacter sp. M11 TaxID=2993565 RepID=UPI002D7F3A35|nr:antibiotic biosynthesis monooxygenase [Leucobacter sp. M11]MEB4613120.1 antibiotic biosynthesis monooxygenase [Leucobacter sp. M11]